MILVFASKVWGSIKYACSNLAIVPVYLVMIWPFIKCRLLRQNVIDIDLLLRRYRTQKITFVFIFFIGLSSTQSSFGRSVVYNLFWDTFIFSEGLKLNNRRKNNKQLPT